MMPKFIECYGHILNTEQIECVCKIEGYCAIHISFLQRDSAPAELEFADDESRDKCYQYLKEVLCG